MKRGDLPAEERMLLLDADDLAVFEELKRFPEMPNRSRPGYIVPLGPDEWAAPAYRAIRVIADRLLMPKGALNRMAFTPIGFYLLLLPLVAFSIFFSYLTLAADTTIFRIAAAVPAMVTGSVAALCLCEAILWHALYRGKVR